MDFLRRRPGPLSQDGARNRSWFSRGQTRRSRRRWGPRHPQQAVHLGSAACRCVAEQGHRPPQTGWDGRQFQRSARTATLQSAPSFPEKRPPRAGPCEKPRLCRNRRRGQLRLRRGAIANAKQFGAKYVVVAWIPHEKGKFNEQNCRDAIAVFNQAGERLRDAGLRFAYHLHGYEFQPCDAGTLFDLMVAETKPEFVAFELDVFWALHGGADPVQLLHRYGSRFELMHVKDLKKGVKGNLTGNAPDDWSVAVGNGQVDWPGLLREAQRAELKHYFIEDESVEAIEQIPQSLRYLERVAF